jgi:hypothetical protein
MPLILVYRTYDRPSERQWFSNHHCIQCAVLCAVAQDAGLLEPITALVRLP